MQDIPRRIDDRDEIVVASAEGELNLRTGFVAEANEAIFAGTDTIVHSRFRAKARSRSGVFVGDE